MQNTTLIVETIKDVTADFKSKVFLKKLSSSLNTFDRQAYKGLTHLTNLHVYSYTCLVDGHEIEFKAQSGEEIKYDTLRFLN